MTTKRLGLAQWIVRCDHCESRSTIAAPSARDALEAARDQEGWVRHRIEDHCPECRSELLSNV